MSVTACFRLPVRRARDILGQVERAVSRWRPLGCKLGLTAPQLDQLADAFEHPQRQAARRASGGR